MSYTNEQKSFISFRNNLKIFYQSWKKTDAKRVLVIQHGFGEHSDRYKNLLDKLKDSDFNIYALDSRGHGRSEGIRGHVEQFQYYVDDLSHLIHIAQEENNTKKIFLLGHSLGGVIALQYSLELNNQDYLHALLLSAPGLKVKMDLEKEVKKIAARYLAVLMPDFVLDANLDVNFLSHDKAVIDAYNKDPLVHGKISFQMANNLFHLSHALYKKAHRLTAPVFLMHGDADGIVDVRGSIELEKALSSAQVSLKVYPGLYHEMMNEPPESREKVLDDLKYFIDSIVPESKPVSS
ncbi:MAG: lysophospholipase [Leptospiraceae bacterium]|nr:lysophospholipase [Leptospiraceae bacterium]